MTDRNKPDPPLDRMRDVADASFKTWTDVTCNGKSIGLSIRETEALGECNAPEYNKAAPNANTIIFISNWVSPLPADAFGLTLVWHNPQTGEIYDADMQINETLGKLAICNGTCSSGQVDLQNVVTHEAGHFLGLGHSMDLQATMAARATVGETKKRDLDQDDRDGICSIYSALSSGAPSCSDSDYEPDCGFSAECMPPTSEATCTDRVAANRSSSGCSATAFGAGHGGWGAFLAVLALAAIRLRSRQSARRVSR